MRSRGELPGRETIKKHNIPTQENIRGLSALRNDALNKESLKPPICYVVKLSYESHIEIISYLFDDLSLSLSLSPEVPDIVPTVC